MKGSFTSLPRAIRKAPLDNATLVTGTLLPFKKEWQRLANQEPAGTILIVLTPSDTSYRPKLRDLAERMMVSGCKIKLLTYIADKP